MIRYREVALVSLALVTLLSASGQSGPNGDKNVGAMEDVQSSGHPAIVHAKYGNIPEQGAVKYSPGSSDRDAWTLEYKVEDVREMWLKSDKQSTSEVNSVRKSALASADALARIPDGRLNLGGLIIKDEYACFGYVIAGANTTSKSVQLLLAKKAERFCKTAASQLAKADEPQDTNAIAVSRWETRSEEHPRIAYLLAMSKCLRGTSSGDKRFEIEAREIISSEIPPYYLDRYPPKADYVLHACLTE